MTLATPDALSSALLTEIKTRSGNPVHV